MLQNLELPNRSSPQAPPSDRGALDGVESKSRDVADGPGVQPVDVALEGVAVRRGRRTVWSGAHVSIPRGAFVGVIGANGAGKTTLLRLLLGQVKASAGSVSVLGAPARRGNSAIGYVPQRHTLEGALALRGRDLVLLGLTGRRWGFGRASQSERAAVVEALHAVGAEGYAEKAVGLLSGGEQQRLLLAQALVTEPRLLLLDEPLTSLDLRSQHAIIQLVDTLRRERSFAVLFVAHDVNPLLDVLDSVMYIQDGRLLTGTVGDVIDADLLSRLYATDVHVHRTLDGRRFVAGA